MLNSKYTVTTTPLIRARAFFPLHLSNLQTSYLRIRPSLALSEYSQVSSNGAGTLCSAGAKLGSALTDDVCVITDQ